MNDVAPTGLPGWIMWLGYGGYVVGGVVTLFNRYRQENIKQAKDLIDTLERRLNMLEESNNANTAKVEKLMAENTVLKELILGRDPDEKKYRDAALKAMAQIESIYEYHLAETRGE